MEIIIPSTSFWCRDEFMDLLARMGTSIVAYIFRRIANNLAVSAYTLFRKKVRGDNITYIYRVEMVLRNNYFCIHRSFRTANIGDSMD